MAAVFIEIITLGVSSSKVCLFPSLLQPLAQILLLHFHVFILSI